MPTGLAASSLTSVSMQPPLVLVCLAHTSTTWPTLRTAARLGISVFASDHSDVARALSAKTGDRFDDIPPEVTEQDAILVRGSALWLECSIEHEFRAGDHDIAVLRVARCSLIRTCPEMVLHGSKFRQLAVSQSRVAVAKRRNPL